MQSDGGSTAVAGSSSPSTTAVPASVLRPAQRPTWDVVTAAHQMDTVGVSRRSAISTTGSTMPMELWVNMQYTVRVRGSQHGGLVQQGLEKVAQWVTRRGSGQDLRSVFFWPKPFLRYPMAGFGIFFLHVVTIGLVIPL